jgi:hypothetical protein
MKSLHSDYEAEKAASEEILKKRALELEHREKDIAGRE